MEIKASDVKELRQKTGAGMMDCKKALAESGGDFAKAEKLLKELGLAAAAKRSGRATNEGRVFTHVTDSAAAMVEISCETDFVARNDDFVTLGNAIAADMAATGKDISDDAYQNRLKDAMVTIKENMTLSRATVLKTAVGQMVRDYIHGDSGKIGVLVKVAAADPSKLGDERLKAFAFDTALHVAAFRPTFLSAERADAAYVAEQQEIFVAQAKQLGKPENVTQGIAAGKLKKHLAEICLLEQGFVKDEKRSVSQAAADLGKEIGTTVDVVEFVYYMVGEDT